MSRRIVVSMGCDCTRFGELANLVQFLAEVNGERMLIGQNAQGTYVYAFSDSLIIRRRISGTHGEDYAVTLPYGLAHRMVTLSGDVADCIIDTATDMLMRGDRVLSLVRRGDEVSIMRCIDQQIHDIQCRVTSDVGSRPIKFLVPYVLGCLDGGAYFGTNGPRDPMLITGLHKGQEFIALLPNDGAISDVPALQVPCRIKDVPLVHLGWS